jgi:large subunit ribosomal protein L34
MSKNTLNGTKKKAIKTSGFRARRKTKTGKNILRKRRRKGRWQISF